MMEIDMDKTHWDNNGCPKYDCRKAACKCGLKYVNLPAALGDDSKNSPVAPRNGAYCNAVVEYMANGHIYLYSSEGVPIPVEKGVGDLEKMVEELGSDLAQETLDRQAADDVLQQEIDDIKNSPDVVDIVPTYAALQAYDTSKLGNNDIIRVLTDETHDGASSYYRWDKQTETWTYIGSIQTAANTIFYANLSETGNTRHIYKNSDMTGTVSVQELLDANEDGQVILRMSSAQTPENFNDAYLQNTYVGVDDYQFLFLDNRNYYEYDGTATTDTSYYYSKSTIQLELTAGNNITITGNTISATDTTYSNFAGTDGQTVGVSGLVPAPATTDANKYLKSDGTWATVSGGGGGGEKNVFYGTCSTGITTNAKVVDCADFTVADLKAGTVIIIKFSYYNAANFPTLNINNTGAVATTIAAHMWTNNEIVAFVHNGTSWDMVESGMATTSIAGVVKLTDSTTSTSANSALVPKALNDALSTMITGASPYSTSATYAVGDYCRNGNVVYQCNTAIVGGETWNASHWDAVPSLQDQLDNTETWTFELEGGTTVTKKVVVR